VSLWDIAPIDAVNSLNQCETIVSGIYSPVLFDVCSWRADYVNIYAEPSAAAEVEHQGGTALEDERAARTGQGFKQAESTDDLFYE
jgi:hypothetical protein